MTAASDPTTAPATDANSTEPPTPPAPSASPSPGQSHAAAGVLYGLKLFGASLMIATLISLVFSPRFVLWNGLHIPEAWSYPEVNRAVPALQQVAHPFTEIARVVAVIRWRLLMPIIAHVTGMPDWLYLALPHLGCLLVLAFVLHIVRRDTGSWPRAWVAAVIVGGSPWLFTSMGWLAYFDSWLVLAALVASFVRSRWLLAIVYLLAPWIDERIIIAAPLCLLVRAAYLYRSEPRPMRIVLLDTAVVAALVVPYVVARLLLIRGSDNDSAYYVSSTIEVMRTIPLSRFIAGLWFAHRAAWWFIAAMPVMLWAMRGWRWGVAADIIVIVTAAASLMIAGDLSRSLAVLIPACLAGLMLLWEQRRRFADISAAIVVLLTFLLPAQHVVTSFVIPIRSVFHEVEVLQSPPDEVNPHAHIKVATAAAREGDLGKALHFVDNAIKLDRAPFATQESSLDSADIWLARQVTDTVLAADPNAPQALLLRARLSDRTGNRAAAVADLERALEFAPPDWPDRATADRELTRLQRGG